MLCCGFSYFQKKLVTLTSFWCIVQRQVFAVQWLRQFQKTLNYRRKCSTLKCGNAKKNVHKLIWFEWTTCSMGVNYKITWINESFDCIFYGMQYCSWLSMSMAILGIRTSYISCRKSSSSKKVTAVR